MNELILRAYDKAREVQQRMEHLRNVQHGMRPQLGDLVAARVAAIEAALLLELAIQERPR